MNNEDKLKPCPFCGAIAEKNIYPGGENFEIIHSDECQITRIMGHDIQYVSLNVENKIWNTRHPAEIENAHTSPLIQAFIELIESQEHDHYSALYDAGWSEKECSIKAREMVSKYVDILESSTGLKYSEIMEG